MRASIEVRGLLISALLAASLAGVAACSGLENTLGPENVTGVGGHEPAPVDPWEVLERENREGPPRYTSRLHSCAKMRVQTIGNLLASRGVDLAATDPISAGQIYLASAAALGGASYADRARETLTLGVGIAARLFDLFLQAAPEIIANLASRPACPGVELFTAAGTCVADGVTCLIGVPATRAHLDVCDSTVARAPDLESGKRLAVAALASAAHICE
jgi:hypothetical protein